MLMHILAGILAVSGSTVFASANDTADMNEDVVSEGQSFNNVDEAFDEDSYANESESVELDRYYPRPHPPRYPRPLPPRYPQPGYPQPGYPQPGYPQPGYPSYPRCVGQRYEWSNVGGYQQCFLTRQNWAPQLGQCEWNRVYQVPNRYCR